MTRAPLLAVALVAAPAAAAPPAHTAVECRATNTEADTFWAAWRQSDDPNVAVAEATEAAHAAARAQLCAGMTGLLCEARLQHLRPVGDAAPQSLGRDGWGSCARYVFPTAQVAELAQRVRVVEAELRATAARLPQGALHVEAPRWSNGADAGTPGAALREELVARAKELGRTIVASPRADAAHVRLRLTLTKDGEATLVPVLEGTGEELQGFSFPTAMFAIDERAVREALRYDVFGMSGPTRAGLRGLEVRLELDGPERDFCEGASVLPEAQALVPGATPTPTDLMIFAVDANQNAILIAREPTSVLRAPEPLTLLDTSDGRQEAIFAVALPAGRPGPWSRWQPYCVVPQRVHASMFGPEAALSFVSYTVHRDGTGRCGAVDPQRAVRREEAKGVLGQLPRCGDP